MSAALKPMKECPYYKGMGFYTSDSNFDPAVEWPGTAWQKLEGVFILAASSGHPVGESGGEETHTLSVDEMPDHRHNAVSTSGNSAGVSLYPFQMVTSVYSTVDTNVILPTGGNQPHNNMPPYISRIYWERIA